MKIRFARPAQAGLREITAYIARDNPARARSFAREIRAKAADIANMPLAFPVVARFERQEIRRRVFGNYGIYYRVDGDMVLIVQILHAARDIESLLPSGP